jgi:YD repeat-containing protein
MRQTANETLKHHDGITTLTQTIQYGYDNLNRLISETATDANGDGYESDYTLDIVGNRVERTVTANGQVLTTQYHYDSNGRDKLEKEMHTGPLALVPNGNERYYAYADGSYMPQIPAKNMRGQAGTKGHKNCRIGPVKAFMMGLPNEIGHYLLVLALVCVPVMFFAPLISITARIELKKMS